jgi:transposase
MDAYSKEFRRDVLAACDGGGGTREVALQFGVSESWVRRVKQERREQGKVAPKTTRDRRKSWEPHAGWLLAKLDQQPDVYLRELQAAAQQELGWEVSDVTLSRACRVLRRTRKKRRVSRSNNNVKTSRRHVAGGRRSSSRSTPTESSSSTRRGLRPT